MLILSMNRLLKAILPAERTFLHASLGSALICILGISP